MVPSASARPRWPSGLPPGWTARPILEERENPFLPDFYKGRPGGRAAGPALLPPEPSPASRRPSGSPNLFTQVTICDYVFDKDKIFAYLNLDDNELFIYQRLYDLLAADIPSPDLVIYLQAPTDVLAARWKRARPCGRPTPKPWNRTPTTCAS